MQISRHWRMNPLRYRLQGVRYANGEVSLQARPQPVRENSDLRLSESVAKTVLDATAAVEPETTIEGKRKGIEAA
ncbi:MAG: hypothetical protein ABI758_05135 [Candidatus Woesebacteria bacterium]